MILPPLEIAILLMINYIRVPILEGVYLDIYSGTVFGC